MLRRLYDEARARAERQYGAEDVRTAQAARDLGLFLARQGDASEARAALAEAVRVDEAAVGASAAQTLADVAELAAVSPPSEAVPLWQRAAGAADAGLAARALASLGDVRRAAGDTAGAAALYKRALAKQEAASGANSEAVAVRLNALAVVVEPKDAIPLLERALVIDRRTLGPRHPEAASTEANLAGRLAMTGRVAEAARAAAEALGILQETLGPDHPRCAVTASILADSLAAQNDRARAEKYYRLALAIDERAFGPNDPRTADDRRALNDFLRR
jgi:tetratricopeptide (TPR) repeat protein